MSSSVQMVFESPRSSRGDDSSRRKRAKYTQVAWCVCLSASGFLHVLSQLDTDHLSNECKRRKLKCSGGLTCVRCSRDHIPCVYAHRPSTTSIQGPEVNDEGYVSSQIPIPSQIQSLLSIDQDLCTDLIQSQCQIPGCGQATGDPASGNADPFRPRS